MEPRAAEAWNLLLGDSVPGARRVIPTGLGKETQLGRMSRLGDAGQEGKLHSYSPSRCAEFYFSFYLFLLLKSCFSP